MNDIIKEHEAYLSNTFKRTGVNWITLSTDGPVAGPIIRLFNARKRGRNTL